MALQFSLQRPKLLTPRAGPGQANRPDAPIPCAVSKNLANRDATCLPWVDTRKPEKRVLEVEGHARDLHMYQHTSLASSKREAVEARHGQSAAMPCP